MSCQFEGPIFKEYNFLKEVYTGQCYLYISEKPTHGLLDSEISKVSIE